MKNLIYSVILLLLFATSGHGAILAGYDNRADAVGDYDDITFFWTCESTTLGSDDYSAGDTTATLASSAALNTDAVKIGTNGLDCPTDRDNASFSVSSNDIVNLTNCRIGFWIQLNTGASGSILYIEGSSNSVWFQTGDNNTLDLNVIWDDDDNSQKIYDYEWNYNDVLGAATYGFIEFAFDLPNKKITGYVNGVEIGSATFTDPDDFTISAIYFGNAVVNGNDEYVDNIIISNDRTRDLYALRLLNSSPK